MPPFGTLEVTRLVSATKQIDFKCGFANGTADPLK